MERQSMTEQHRHGDDGFVIAEEPAVEEVAETEADANVEVARIEADRDVAVAKIVHKSEEEDLVAALAAALARIEVLETARIPEQPADEEPPPVVIQAAPEPAPEPVEEFPSTDMPPATEEHHASRRRVGLGMW
jgi:hypothetical protein